MSDPKDVDAAASTHGDHASSDPQHVAGAEPSVSTTPSAAADDAADAPPAGATRAIPTSFDELDMPEALRQAIRDNGWDRPTKVQASAFEPVRQGLDVLVQSQTGTGKTGAFCLPWLAHRFVAGDAAQTGVQLICLVPTRELAKQVCDELVRLARHTEVVPLPVYGGTAMQPQLNALRTGVHAVVGTPGRVLDHIRRRSLDLSKVRMVVLDEADEMLSMGFLEDIHTILDACPDTRQTTLFSATVPPEIERIARRYMRDPLPLRLSGDDIAAAEITHTYYSCNSAVKTRDLLDVIAVEEPTTALVFCNTREEVNLVASVLQREGFAAEPLSSDLTQAARERVLGWMREQRLRFLVATDVASRGIDISHISHVINYSFPENAESYVHRTGRTGRAGRPGQAVSLIAPQELGNFYYLKLQYPSISFSERHLPPGDELQAQRTELKLDQISRAFPELVSPEWTLLARNLMKDPRGERVIAYLLNNAMSQLPRPTSALEREFGEDGVMNERADARRSGRREGGRFGRDRERGRDDRGRDDRGRDDRGRGRDRDRHHDRRHDGETAPVVEAGAAVEVEAETAAPAAEGAAREHHERRHERSDRGRDRGRGRDRHRDRDRDRRGTEDAPSETASAEAPSAGPAEGERFERRRRNREHRRETEAAAADPTAAPPEIATGELEAMDASEIAADTEALVADVGGEAGADEQSLDAGARTIDDGAPAGRRRRRRRRRRRGGGERPQGAEAAESSAEGGEDEGTDDEGADDDEAAAAPASTEIDPTLGDNGADGGRRRRRRRRRGRRRGGDEAATPREPTPVVVSPEPVVPQDAIVIEIDESELQLVRDQFGEIDELDDFTLKGRRRGVLDTLAEEVELEDLSARDRAPGEHEAAAAPAATEADGEADGEADAEGDEGDESGEAEGSAEDSTAEGSVDDPNRRKRRRRRRRKKKAEPEPPPALMAPPHKDFWEVWASHFTYRDFEDPEPTEPPPPEPGTAVADGGSSSSAALVTASEGDLVRVRLNLGRGHAKKAADIRDLLADRTGLAGRAIRNLTVGERDSAFQIGAGAWDRVARGLQGVEVDGVVLEVARIEAETQASEPPADASAVPQFVADADTAPEPTPPS